MSRKKKRKQRSTRERPLREYCIFCVENKEPGYKDYQTLAKLLTDRAKIIGKKRSGLCSKHQRRLSIAIKRARHLGLIPFTPEI